MAAKFRVLWARVAEDDLVAIIRHIHAENPPAARDNLKKIESRAASLDRFPQRGRVVPELKAQGITQYREIVVPPWRMIYRIMDADVYVLAVLDSRQNLEDVLLHRLVRGKKSL